MKKIVYMLLTVLVVMSLFLCVTVSAEGEGATLASGAETTADADEAATAEQSRTAAIRRAVRETFLTFFMERYLIP